MGAWPPFLFFFFFFFPSLCLGKVGWKRWEGVMGGNGGVKLCVLWAQAVVRTKPKVGWGGVCGENSEEGKTKKKAPKHLVWECVECVEC